MRVVQGKAGMFLGGDYELFVFDNPEDAGMFQFPISDPQAGVYEIFHHEVAMIPERAPHVEGS